MKNKLTADIIVTAIVLFVSATVLIQSIQLYNHVSRLEQGVSRLTDQFNLIEDVQSEQSQELSNVVEVVNQVDNKVELLGSRIQDVDEEVQEIKRDKVSKKEDVVANDSIIYEVTAYTAGYESTGKRPGDPYYGITASGARVSQGTTVACPPSLPFGTKLYIESVGERTCQDRGGAIKGNRLDVYMENLSDALSFGRKKLSVKIISS